MPPKQIRKKRNTPKSRPHSPTATKKKTTPFKRTIRGGAAVDSVIQNITDGIDTIVETIGSRSIVDFIRGRSDGNSATNQASDSINKMSETLRKLKKQLNRKTVDDTTFVLAKKASELDKDIRRVLDSFERKTSLQKDNAATLKSIVLRKLVIQHLKTQNDFMQGVKPVTSGVSEEAAKLPSNDAVLDIQISQTELPEKYRTSNNEMKNETYDLKLSIDELNNTPNLDFDKIFTNLKTLMDLKDNIKEGEDLKLEFLKVLIDEMDKGSKPTHYATVKRDGNTNICYVDRPTIIKLAKSYGISINGISINEIKDECNNLRLNKIKSTIEENAKRKPTEAAPGASGAPTPPAQPAQPIESNNLAKKKEEEEKLKLNSSPNPQAPATPPTANPTLATTSASPKPPAPLADPNPGTKPKLTLAEAKIKAQKNEEDRLKRLENKSASGIPGGIPGGKRSKSHRKSMNKTTKSTKSKSKKNI